MRPVTQSEQRIAQTLPFQCKMSTFTTNHMLPILGQLFVAALEPP